MHEVPAVRDPKKRSIVHLQKISMEKWNSVGGIRRIMELPIFIEVKSAKLIGIVKLAEDG